MDLIDRQAAIRWVKTECNPYGNPTLDFESGKKVIEHLEQMPPAQPKITRCKDCTYFLARNAFTGRCDLRGDYIFTNDFCSYAVERRTDGMD